MCNDVADSVAGMYVLAALTGGKNQWLFIECASNVNALVPVEVFLLDLSYCGDDFVLPTTVNAEEERVLDIGQS